MSWLVGAVLVLAVILLVVAIVQRLARMAMIAALVGFGGLAAYYLLLAAAPPVVQDAVHQAGEQAVKVGAQVGAGALHVGKQAVDAGGKAAGATSAALEKLQKEPAGTSPPDGGKKP